MLRAAGETLDVHLVAVDSNGLLPMSAGGREFTRAHSFRRHLQKTLRPHLDDLPRAHPLVGAPLPDRPAMPETIASEISSWIRNTSSIS